MAFRARAMGISIHSLRMEGDVLLQEDAAAVRTISIHSLRMEGDDYQD